MSKFEFFCRCLWFILVGAVWYVCTFVIVSLVFGSWSRWIYWRWKYMENCLPCSSLTSCHIALPCHSVHFPPKATAMAKDAVAQFYTGKHLKASPESTFLSSLFISLVLELCPFTNCVSALWFYGLGTIYVKSLFQRLSGLATFLLSSRVCRVEAVFSKLIKAGCDMTWWQHINNHFDDPQFHLILPRWRPPLAPDASSVQHCLPYQSDKDINPPLSANYPLVLTDKIACDFTIHISKQKDKYLHCVFCQFSIHTKQI